MGLGRLELPTFPTMSGRSYHQLDPAVTLRALPRAFLLRSFGAGGEFQLMDYGPRATATGWSDASGVVILQAYLYVLAVTIIVASTALALQNVCEVGHGEGWWAWVDLNYRPRPYQGRALAT